jgi:hypothetical protein
MRLRRPFVLCIRCTLGIYESFLARWRIEHIVLFDLDLGKLRAFGGNRATFTPEVFPFDR